MDKHDRNLARCRLGCRCCILRFFTGDIRVGVGIESEDTGLSGDECRSRSSVHNMVISRD